MSNLIDSMIEISLNDKDDFLKVKETLTRIGIASRKDNTLYQSCHILHKQGKYYITHFKELFALDGKETDFSENDISRRNTIANLLAEWGLITLVDPAKSADLLAPISQIKIIAFKDKNNWNLQSKYNIGNK
jgi:Bacteriophage translational regulator